MNTNISYIVFESIGTVEKDLYGTAVVRALKKKYPERNIVVVTVNPDVWLHNPHVYRVYNTGRMMYFYDDYIKSRDTMIFRMDPFLTEDYAYRLKHIVEIWCDLCQIKHDGLLPDLYLTEREFEIGRNILKKSIGKKTAVFLETSNCLDLVRESGQWRTSLHQFITSKLSKLFFVENYVLIQSRAGNNQKINGSIEFVLPLRQIIAVCAITEKRILNQGFLQIAMAGLKLPSTVYWIGSAPEILGFDGHINIQAKLSQKFKTYIVSHPQFVIPDDAQELGLFLPELETAFTTEDIFQSSTSIKSDSKNQSFLKKSK